jgi:hypothetical protein
MSQQEINLWADSVITKMFPFAEPISEFQNPFFPETANEPTINISSETELKVV